MKKILSVLLLILTVVLPSCNKDSDNGISVEETRMNMIVEPHLYTPAGSAANRITYMVCSNKATNEKFHIPVGDILGFQYEENYTYELVVLVKVAMKDGIQIDSPIYTLVSVVSKIYTPDEAPRPKPVE